MYHWLPTVLNVGLGVVTSLTSMWAMSATQALVTTPTQETTKLQAYKLTSYLQSSAPLPTPLLYAEYKQLEEPIINISLV